MSAVLFSLHKSQKTPKRRKYISGCGLILLRSLRDARVLCPPDFAYFCASLPEAEHGHRTPPQGPDRRTAPTCNRRKRVGGRPLRGSALHSAESPRRRGRPPRRLARPRCALLLLPPRPPPRQPRSALLQRSREICSRRSAPSYLNAARLACLSLLSSCIGAGRGGGGMADSPSRRGAPPANEVAVPPPLRRTPLSRPVPICLGISRQSRRCPQKPLISFARAGTQEPLLRFAESDVRGVCAAGASSARPLSRGPEDSCPPVRGLVGLFRASRCTRLEFRWEVSRGVGRAARGRNAVTKDTGQRLTARNGCAASSRCVPSPNTC